MELIDVECESEQEKLCFSLSYSSGQEASEISVLLQYAEGSLYLYGAILTKDVSFINSNAFGSFGFLLRHCFGEGKPPVLRVVMIRVVLMRQPLLLWIMELLL